MGLDSGPHAASLQSKGHAAMTGEELREARQELGWTQSALASAIGTTLRAVQYYEAGTRPIPGPVDKLVTVTLDLARKLNATT